uniref:PPM-type phosphatase domain-containing protein n=1 Tax=Laticauda laticaudata TaxID=8630 RepID=A0A8C5RTD6_LATLA
MEGLCCSLAVSLFSDQGGWKYMEDMTQIMLELKPKEEKEDIVAARRRAANCPGQDAKGATGAATLGSSPPPLAPHGYKASVAFFAVCNGHGGQEVAHFAHQNLWPFIKKQKGFRSTKPETVMDYMIRNVQCHLIWS